MRIMLQSKYLERVKSFQAHECAYAFLKDDEGTFYLLIHGAEDEHQDPIKGMVALDGWVGRPVDLLNSWQDSVEQLRVERIVLLTCFAGWHTATATKYGTVVEPVGPYFGPIGFFSTDDSDGGITILDMCPLDLEDEARAAGLLKEGSYNV